MPGCMGETPQMWIEEAIDDLIHNEDKREIFYEWFEHEIAHTKLEWSGRKKWVHNKLTSKAFNHHYEIILPYYLQIQELKKKLKNKR